MSNFTEIPPLSLYVHIPWCVRKCPYCDFNSHEARDKLPEKAYVMALLQELETHLPCVQGRPIQSIFFGGGTPSLFSANAIAALLDGITKKISISSTIEITLEANPGTIDQQQFKDLRTIGINRLSLGIQSLQNDKLKTLGRIHNREEAIRSIAKAIQAGFSNFNLDLMYGLPNQSIEDALQDLENALTFHPKHLSWYQLTIEPNTVFNRKKPNLPSDDLSWEMQNHGQQLLQEAGFTQYEVSAYALPNKKCLHNRNYWEFGDYIGIGAGAHSKITHFKTHTVCRFAQIKQPNSYLDTNKRKKPQYQQVSDSDLIFEFMLNALRLTKGFEKTLFNQRTGLSLQRIKPLLNMAKARKLLSDDNELIIPTILGKRFLNDLITIFLPPFTTC